MRSQMIRKTGNSGKIAKIRTLLTKQEGDAIRRLGDLSCNKSFRRRMNSFLEDEYLDEIPVESRFLLGDAVGGLQERDPLREDEDAMVEEHPLEVVSVLPLTKTLKVTVERMTETHPLLSRRPLPPVPLTTVSHPLAPLKEKSSLPSKYANMSFTDFTQEMEQSVINIVQESVELFHRDPREYHPVYLRIFKYITIGQELGYIENDEEHVKDVWSGFFKFAETQFQLSQTTARTTFVFDGERSAYATYQLTKKLDEKVASFPRNENERQKMFRELQNKVKKIRKEWIESPSRKDKILEDLDARLKFFNECKLMTHPADCIKMNNLWRKFLSQEGIPGRTQLNPRSEEDISTTSASAIGLGVGVTGPSTENVVKSEGQLPATSENKKDDDKADEESKQTLRKFIIRVIVAPSKTASDLSVAPQQEPSLKEVDTLAPASPQILSLPPSPCQSLSPIRPSSPFSPGIDEELGTISQSPANPKLQKVASSSDAVSPKATKLGKGSKKSKPTKKFKMPGAGIKSLFRRKRVSQVAKQPLRTTKFSVRFKKKKLFGKLASVKKNHDFMARQIKFERILSQTNAKLLSSVIRKKSIARKVDSAESETKKSVDDRRPTKDGEVLLASSTSKSGKDTPTLSTKKAAKKLHDKKISRINKSKSVIGKRKMRKALLNLRNKKKSANDTQTKLKQIIKRSKKKKNVNSSSKAKRKKSSKSSTRDECLATKREIWKRYTVFWSIETVCPVCDLETNVGSLCKHLRNIHEIEEDGDLWRCPVCVSRRKFARRITWLGHMNSQHEGKVNLEEMVEVAKQVNTKVDWKTLKYKMEKKTVKTSKKVDEGSKSQHSRPSIPASTRKPASAGTTAIREEKREMCDICGEWYLPRYIPIHKDVAHNPNRRQTHCPSCPYTFVDPVNVWLHYCEYHIRDEGLGFLDPAPVEDKQTSKLSKGRTTGVSGNPDEPVACEICGKIFYNGHSLNRHVHQIHNEGEIEETFVCPHCPKAYKVKDVLTRHIQTVHEGMYTCKQCGRKHQSAGKLWRHLVDAHGMSAADAAAECGVSFVECAYCGEEHLQGRQMKNHVNAQHPEKFQEFTQTYELQKPRYENKREQRRLFKEQGIAPPWIQREFKRYANKLPSEGMKCTIEGCGVILKSKRNLKRHLRVKHTENILDEITEKQAVTVVEKTELYTTHLCMLCGEYLYHIQEVKVHVVACHPELFRDGDGDEQAAPASTPVQEFECPHCPSKYSSDEDVRGHVETSHSDLCWRCPECSKVMLGPDDLDKHFQVDHSNENDQGDGPNQGKEDEMKGVPLPIFKRRRGKLIDFDSEKEKKRMEIREEHRKFGTIKVHCEICKRKLSICSLSKHLLKVHGVVEDPLACTFCPESEIREFKPTSPTGRASWVYHVNLHHLNEISFEEIIERVSKVNSSKDWRTLQIKVIDGDGDEPAAPAPASTPVQEFECPHCPSKYPSDEDVRGHVQTSHSDLCCRCPECSKVMLGPDDLDKHFQVDHSNENDQGDGPNQGKEEERKDVTFPIFKRRRRGKLMKLCSEKERMEIKEEQRKFGKIKVHCDICKRELSICSLSKHLLKVHRVVEDLLTCTFCPEGPKFKPTSHTGRASWAYHMNMHHLHEISFEEILELVSKVNRKDWRTLQIKNPRERKELLTLSKAQAEGKKRSSSAESSEESDSDGDEKEDIELDTISKKARESQVSRNLRASLSQRTVKRKKTLDSSDEYSSDSSDFEGTQIKVAVSLSPPRRSCRESAKRAVNQIKKYAETLKEQDVEGKIIKNIESNSIEGEKVDSGKKGVGVTSKKPVKNVTVTRPASIKKAMNNRLLRRGVTMNDITLKITASSLSKDKSKEDEVNLVENIENEKRLVIELVRLTEKEVESHLRKYSVL